MAGAPTEQEVQQYLEARIETAVRELLYGNAGGNQNPRSEDVFPPTTGEHVHIAYGYAQSIRDDPDCPVLQYEGEAAAITGATPGGPKKWHNPDEPATIRGQWGQYFSIEANPEQTWEHIFNDNAGERPVMPRVWRGDVTGPRQTTDETYAKADNESRSAKRDLFLLAGRTDPEWGIGKRPNKMHGAHESSKRRHGI